MDAERQGLDPTVAEKTYRAMIAAFEDFERAEWTRRQGGEIGLAPPAASCAFRFGANEPTQPLDQTHLPEYR